MRAVQMGVVIGLLLSTPIGLHSEQKKCLTLQQVEQLIRFSRDDVTAGEIREKGLCLTVTPEVLDNLRKKGAKRETVRALAARLVDTTLKIFVNPPEPDCEVIIDDSHRYRTDRSGHLTIRDLEPGRHVIVVRKLPRFVDTQEIVDLPRPKELRVNLKLAKGWLTVTVIPPVPGATIGISRLGTYKDSVKHLECDAGAYRVSVSAPRYRNFSGDVTVPPGEHIEVGAAMQVDEDAFWTLVAEMNAAFAQRKFAEAIAKAREVLALRPKYRDALRVLAQCYFATDQFEHAVTYGKRALEEGVEVEFPVQHHHGFNDTHAAKLVVSTDMIRLDPMVSYCEARKITPSAITRMEVAPNRRGDELLLNLELKDPASGRKMRLDFGDAKSQVDEGLRGNTIIPRTESAACLKAVQQVLEYARSRAQ